MKTKRWSWLRAGPAVLFLAGLASPVLGQAVNATVTGTLTDNSGGVVKAASVVAVNPNTGVEYSTKTSDAGVYTITGLPVGTYTIRAESQGFKTVTTNPITLEVGQTARINIRLEVGAVTEEVQVVGFSPILQTENGTVSEVVTGSTMVALPLNGRNPFQFTLLVPGVQHHSPDTFYTPKQSSDSGRPYVNGQREQGNNFMLDGIDQNEAVDNLVAYYPSPDAIAEMRVETNNYSAEFGNVAGGVITAVTKSGTNDFHGNLFEFARNDKFDANSWANNRSGAEKADLNQHIFGGTLGGPLAKNKVFFFVNYQGTRIDRPGDATASVAPAAWRNGDFSSLLAQGIVLTDPATGRPFANNQVPTSRFSPAARALLADTSRYPLPNRPGTTGNYVHSANRSTRNHQGDLKLDANLGPSDNIFVRASVGKFDTSQQEAIFPLAFGNGFLSDTQSVAFNWTHVFGPSAVSEFRAGFSHVTIDDTPVDPAGVGDYNAALGIPGGQAIPGLSSIGFGNSGIDGIGTPGIAHNTNNKTFQVSEKFSLLRGKHFLSVGGQLIHYRMNQLYATNSGLLGTFNFGGAGFGTGFGFSNFLLDQVFGKTVLLSLAGTPAADWTQLQNRIGLFIQDDFKPSAKLTLNLGLRWEYASPIVEKDDRQVNYNIDTGAILRPGENGNSRALYDAYYGGFGPRLGFAWTANDKTVVRGGYGIVQYMEGTGANCRLPINPPFYNEATRTYTTTPGSIARGFQDLGAADAPSIGSVQLRAWQTDIKPQLTQQWNLFYERKVTDTTSLGVGYVGSKSTRVVSFRDYNQPLPGVGNPANWASFASRRRLPQYINIRYTSDESKASYHGLQTSLRRRRAGGLEFLASYTFSKALGDNQGFYGPGWGGRSANQGTAGIYGDGNYNSYDPSLDYGPLWFSATHSGSLAASYELPFGKDRKHGSSWSGAKQALLGGWNVSSILSLRSGLPITVVSGWGPGRSQQTSGFTFERPDRVGDPSVSGADWDRWLNLAAFAQQPLGQFGNSGVGVARGPGFYNIDLGVDKNIDLGGSRSLTLRIEAFNVLNHSNKGLPIRDITSPDFGKILETASTQRILEFAAKLHFDDD